MANYSADVEIGAVPAAVFPYLTDPGRIRAWLGGFIESRPVGGNELKVGARSIEVIEERGRRIEMRSVVTELDPPRRLEVELDGRVGRMRNRYTLALRNGGTHVTLTMRADYRGVARLFAPFVHGMVRRKLAGDLARLKQAVESA